MSERAKQLGREFDLSFQQEPEASRESLEKLLLIQAGSQTYALRLRMVEGLVRDKSITPLPGSPPQQLGIAGLRGLLVTVFSLAALRDEPASQQATWLALVGGIGEGKVALAFDALEGQLSLQPEALLPCSHGPLVEAIVVRESGPLPVLSVAGLLERIALIAGARS